MSELPAPLSAPDCYLGGYDFMPLLGTRLFASEFYGLALKNPRAGLAAMKLWWLAYSEQRPAGSLPGSEDDLCRMADLGTDLKAWRAVRSVALHGFVQCSDGRYYHPVICKEAAVAYAARVAERDRKAKWRAKQQAKAAENNEEPEPEPQECPAGQDGDGTGTGRGHDGDGTRMSALTGQDRTGQDSKKEEREGRKEDPPKPPAVGGRSKACRENPEFAVFYANYPRKDAPDDALKAWKALIAAGVNPDEILEGLSRYAFSSNPQYIRLPASWLRGGCWRAVTDNRDPVLVAAGFDFDAIDDDPLASLQRPELLS